MFSFLLGKYLGIEWQLPCLTFSGTAKWFPKHLYFFFLIITIYVHYFGLSQWLSSKESVCHAGNEGDVGSIPDQEDLLEKEIATRCSILSWEIPWTEEPAGYGPQKSLKRLSAHYLGFISP